MVGGFSLFPKVWGEQKLAPGGLLRQEADFLVYCPIFLP